MKLKSKVEVMNLPFLISAVYGSIVFIDIGWFSAGPNEPHRLSLPNKLWLRATVQCIACVCYDSQIPL